VSGARDDRAPWRLLDSRLALDVPWYRVRCDTLALPDGSVIDYYVSERRDVALVFAVTEEREVVLVRQYKHGAGETTLELPGGMIEPGEDAPAAAARELREETGYAPGPAGFVQIAAVHEDTSKNTNRVFSFLAPDARRVGDERPEAAEVAGGLRVELHPLDAVPGMIGTAVTAQSSLLAILLALDALARR
jgi:ADP-ribose pyrophosphatase